MHFLIFWSFCFIHHFKDIFIVFLLRYTHGTPVSPSQSLRYLEVSLFLNSARQQVTHINMDEHVTCIITFVSSPALTTCHTFWSFSRLVSSHRSFLKSMNQQQLESNLIFVVVVYHKSSLIRGWGILAALRQKSSSCSGFKKKKSLKDSNKPAAHLTAQCVQRWRRRRELLHNVARENTRLVFKWQRLFYF